MTDETKKMLEEVAVKRISESDQYESGSNESKQAFKEGLDAIDKLTELEKLEVSKAQKEKELKESKKNNIFSTVLRVLEVAAIPIALCLINNKAKSDNIDKINEFESNEDGIYTSSNGRNVTKYI